jgi:hypothetical protein
MKKIAFAILTFLISSSFIFLNGDIFRWHFDKFKKLTFKYGQVESTKSGFFVNKKMNIFNKLDGKLVVKVKSDTLADIVLEDLKMTMCNIDSLGDTSTVMIRSVPEMFIQDLKEDGSYEGQLNGQMEMFAKTLFPIINKKAEIGDSTDLPMAMPFNLFGSTINVKGYNRVKYLGNAEGVDKFETVINVSEYTIPDEVKTNYKCYMKGNSKFDFNSQKGYFTKGVININVAIGAESSESPKSMLNMSMDMNTQIVLQLVTAE